MAAAADAAATTGSSASWSPPDPIPLQEYLAGHVLREAQQVFEGGINPFVKDAMKATYGTEPDPAAVAQLAAADTAAADEIRTAELPAAEAAATAAAGSKKGGKARAAVHKLKQRLWVLDPAEADAAGAEFQADRVQVVQHVAAAAAADPTNAKEAQMAAQALKEVDSELGAISDARAAAAAKGPPPLWLEKCRQVLSSMMASFVDDDGAEWDVFTLTSIMQA